ncbi:MAG: sugar phosphate isomerase/epimerase [Clostridia bacterium]|nr:sugar phosphate isomerase/epimerase [Clostridia bacterium]
MIYRKISGFSDEISESIDVQFETLNRLKIEWFEPRGIDGTNISALSDEKVSELVTKMKKHNIKASSIGSPIGKVRLDEDFNEHFELFKRVVSIAEKLSSKYIRMFSFYHDGGSEWSDKEREEVISRLSKMIGYAKEKNIVLLHENEKDVYGDTIERCVDLMENLYCDNFKAVFDPANFVQCGQDTLCAYSKMRPYIEYLHIKDSDEQGNVVPAGQGEGNIEEIIKGLIADGYDGFISLEPHLGSFTGLDALENDDKMTKLEKSDEQKFVLAFNSLNEILERI